MKRVKREATKVFKYILLIILITASFAYAMFQGGFVSWFLFASFIPFSCYALCLSFYPLKKLKVERMLKQTEYNAGEKISVQLKISRNNSFPILFLILEDKVSDKLLRRTSRKYKFLLFLNFKREIIHEYTIEKIPRGEYVFYGCSIKTGDLFSLVEKSAFFECKQRILVYPAAEDLHYQPFEAQFDHGMTATKDKVQRDSTMAISLREYEPGDRFSWINWKASARKNELMTKEFEQRQSHDIILALDRTPNGSFDVAVNFSASVIQAVLKKGAQIGLYSSGASEDYFPIKRGAFQQRTLQYFLAKVEDDAEIPFAKILQSERRLFHKNLSTFIILTEISNEVVETLSKVVLNKNSTAIFLIKRKNVRVTEKEYAILQLARQRGFIAKIIFEGEFQQAFVRGEQR
ncbi:DUF58 domain-containing protein [Bacillus kwashiorkori]|uniref:DUF58 domain-containing protein n=1 Tax=Bacillus kwashiorkori TaxID=1522318 RepID=UPI0007862F4E|nr:DUF58 domain-containing protein [Bacillus kwashiorkori]